MYCLRRSLSKSGPVHFGSKNLFISNFSHKSVIETTLVFQNFARCELFHRESTLDVLTQYKETETSNT